MVVAEPVPIGAARGRARNGRGRGSAARSRDLLARVALTLSSSLGLKAVLAELTALTLTASGGDRCSIFLLDDGRFLGPAVAVGPRDEAMWRAFRALAPLDVQDVPGLAAFLADGHALAVPDAAVCPLIPHAWVDAFAVRSAVLVPLHALGEPCGVLAVDYRHPYAATADEVAVLEVVASYAGLAVRNARLFDAERRRARVQTELAAAAGTLASLTEPAAVARALVAAYPAMLDVPAAAAGLRAGGGWSVVTTAGAVARVGDGDVPAPVLGALTAAWDAAPRPVTLPHHPWLAGLVGDRARGSYVALPLGAGSRHGVVLLAVPPGRTLLAEEYAAAEALAAVATTTLDRVHLHRRLQREARHARVLYELASALPERAGATVLMRRLGELLADDGVTVTALRVRDRRLARHLGLAGAAPAREPAPGEVAVPLRVGRRVVGELVAACEGEADHAYLESVGRAVAEAAARGAAAAELEQAARDRAVVAERDRISAELHDGVGQLLVGIGLLAQRSADELPPGSPWAARFVRLVDASREGKWVVDDAVRALAFVPTAQRGLVEALRALARSVAADSGLSVVVRTEGRPRRLGVDAEHALYRVAHQALADAWRHARCTTVVVDVLYEPDAVNVVVRDDGAGLVHRLPNDAAGLTGMRRGIVAAGGTLRVANRSPRGAVVQARVPVGAR
ncbi:MAG TPA: GAF domain-containing protein [Mycobacteriales bacterium]|jgi:signal transduction histidine kinase